MGRRKGSRGDAMGRLGEEWGGERREREGSVPLELLPVPPLSNSWRRP